MCHPENYGRACSAIPAHPRNPGPIRPAATKPRDKSRRTFQEAKLPRLLRVPKSQEMRTKSIKLLISVICIPAFLAFD